MGLFLALVGGPTLEPLVLVATEGVGVGGCCGGGGGGG